MNHLCPAAQQILALSDQERIQHILRGRWIGYAAADEALANLEKLLSHPEVHRMPNRIIVSDTNNGKTSLVRRFVQVHEREDDPLREQSSVPIVLVQAPPTPDRRALFTSILDELHFPYSPTHKKDVLFSQVKSVVPRVGVRMLIIDEIHHLITGDVQSQRVFLNVIKYLGNEWRISIVVAGTSEAYDVIRLDPQMENRFEPIELPRWKNNSEFKRLLQSFESLLPLAQPSNLSTPEIAARLHVMCEGSIGELSKILNQAAIEAIVRQEERITDYILNQIQWRSPSKRKGRSNVGRKAIAS
jgi:hypothetical protein